MKTSDLMKASMEALPDELPGSAFLAPLQDLDDTKTDEVIEGTLVHAQTELTSLESIDAAMELHAVVVAGLEDIAQRLDTYGDAPLGEYTTGIMVTSVEAIAAPVENQLTVSDINDKLREPGQTASEKSGAVREKAKQVVERIAEFLKSLWNRLVDLFHKLLGTAAVVRHRLRRLEEAMKKHNLRVEPTVNQLDVTHNQTVAGIYDNLRIGTVFPHSAVETGKALVAAQEALNSVDNTILDHYELDLNKLKIALQSMNASNFSASITMPIALPKVFKAVNDSANDGSRHVVRYVAGPIPGNWLFVYTSEIGVAAGLPLLRYTSSAEQKHPEEKEAVAATMVPVLSPQELTGLPAVVNKLADGIAQGRTLMDRLRRASDKSAPSQFSAPVYTTGGQILLTAFYSRYREVGRMTMKVNMAMLKGALSLVRWGEGSVAEYPALG